MGDLRFTSADSLTNKDSNLFVIDPNTLLEAILAQSNKKTMPAPENDSQQKDDHGFIDVKPVPSLSPGEDTIRPDSPPKNVRVGVVNPYALVEAILGRKIERESLRAAKILSDVLQTDYDELFDMKYHSVLFAGLKLDEKERKAEMMSEKEMKLLNERDLETPDVSGVRHLSDLKKIGMKDLGETCVKMAHLENGKLCLVVEAKELGKKVSNRELTMTMNELISPFRMRQGRWVMPNGSWRDMYDYFFQSVKKRVIGNLTELEIDGVRRTQRCFDDPIQGCSSNSWLIAAIFSVFWSDPSIINRATRVHQQKDEKKHLAVKFHDKGGENNARTETVEVNYEIPVNNSNNEPMYCRSSDGADIWPSLYEKAFAKWMTGSSSQQPDITKTHSGDPVRAMAQINGHDPHYYKVEKHSPHDMMSMIRSNCMNFKTINPMTCWTYATGEMFRGSNIVANHAYSILGFTMIGEKQYIILRNPWGVTEPMGLNSYQGLLLNVDPQIWNPASMLDQGGLFGMEPETFKKCFAYMGVAKKLSKEN